MPSVKKAWRTLLAGVLGEKAGMKEGKVVKRCVKQARQDPALSALTGDQAAASLAAFLARGGRSGFVARGGRIERVAGAPAAAAAPPPTLPPTQPAEPAKKKGKVAHATAPPPPAAIRPGGDEAGGGPAGASSERATEEQRGELEEAATTEKTARKKGRKGHSEGEQGGGPWQPAGAADAGAQPALGPSLANGGLGEGRPRMKQKKTQKSKKRKERSSAEDEPAAAPVQHALAADGAGGGRPSPPARSAAPQPSRGPAEAEDAEEVRWRASLKRTDVKTGAFSKAETAALRAAMEEYALAKGFSTSDFSWLIVSGRGSRKPGSDTLGVWKAVAASLPQRTVKSVAAAGLRLFHPHARKGPFTPEQDAELLALVEQRGRKWTAIGAALGRTGDSCRDRWKEIRLGAQKARGAWAEEEVEKLKAAVQEYLDARQAGRPSAAAAAGGAEGLSRRAVLDDIDWHAVSTKVGTRSNGQCMEKWYDQLSPSMVLRGDWGAGDDRRMLRALFTASPAAEYEVRWAELVPGRSAAQARRRWRLMVKSVPDHRDMEFPDLIDALVEKHVPHWKQAVGVEGATGQLPQPAD